MVNDELERIREEALEAYSRLYFGICPGGTKESLETLSAYLGYLSIGHFPNTSAERYYYTKFFGRQPV
jgi:hypothetical protein